MQRRLPRRKVDDAEIGEEHAAAETRAKRLRRRLLRREPLGIGRRLDALGAARRFRAFGLGEDAGHEAVAMPRDRSLDAADVADVGAEAEDHGGSGRW